MVRNQLMKDSASSLAGVRQQFDEIFKELDPEAPESFEYTLEAGLSLAQHLSPANKEQIAGLGEELKNALEMGSRGQKLIKEGENLLKEAKAKVPPNEDKLKEGSDKLYEGRLLIKECKAELKEGLTLLSEYAAPAHEDIFLVLSKELTRAQQEGVKGQKLIDEGQKLLQDGKPQEGAEKINEGRKKLSETQEEIRGGIALMREYAEAAALPDSKKLNEEIFLALSKELTHAQQMGAEGQELINKGQIQEGRKKLNDSQEIIREGIALLKEHARAEPSSRTIPETETQSAPLPGKAEVQQTDRADAAFKAKARKVDEQFNAEMEAKLSTLANASQAIPDVKVKVTKGVIGAIDHEISEREKAIGLSSKEVFKYFKAVDDLENLQDIDLEENPHAEAIINSLEAVVDGVESKFEDKNGEELNKLGITFNEVVAFSKLKSKIEDAGKMGDFEVVEKFTTEAREKWGFNIEKPMAYLDFVKTINEYLVEGSYEKAAENLDDCIFLAKQIAPQKEHKSIDKLAQNLKVAIEQEDKTKFDQGINQLKKYGEAALQPGVDVQKFHPALTYMSLQKLINEYLVNSTSSESIAKNLDEYISLLRGEEQEPIDRLHQNLKEALEIGERVAELEKDGDTLVDEGKEEEDEEKIKEGEGKLAEAESLKAEGKVKFNEGIAQLKEYGKAAMQEGLQIDQTLVAYKGFEMEVNEKLIGTSTFSEAAENLDGCIALAKKIAPQEKHKIIDKLHQSIKEALETGERGMKLIEEGEKMVEDGEAAGDEVKVKEGKEMCEEGERLKDERREKFNEGADQLKTIFTT